MSDGTRASATAHPVVLDREAADAIPWGQFRDAEGVQGKLFWESPDRGSCAGLMHLNPGTTEPRHTHRASVHHVWIVKGTCRVDGRELGAGSYSFVPAGVEHGIEQAGEQGCTIFYLYLRSE